MFGDTRRPRNSSRTVAPSWIRCLSHRCAHSFIVSIPAISTVTMLHDSRELMAYAPHLLVAPALLITMTVFGFNLLGEGLRDALDPRR